MTGFRFVDDHQADYHVTDLCRVAKVSRSSYYAWLGFVTCTTTPSSAGRWANAKPPTWSSLRW